MLYLYSNRWLVICCGRMQHGSEFLRVINVISGVFLKDRMKIKAILVHTVLNKAAAVSCYSILNFMWTRQVKSRHNEFPRGL